MHLLVVHIIMTCQYINQWLHTTEMDLNVTISSKSIYHLFVFYTKHYQIIVLLLWVLLKIIIKPRGNIRTWLYHYIKTLLLFRKFFKFRQRRWPHLGYKSGWYVFFISDANMLLWGATLVIYRKYKMFF